MSVLPMLPTFPEVRCDKCRTVYTVSAPPGHIVTGNCPKCGWERFSTSLVGTPGVTVQEFHSHTDTPTEYQKGRSFAYKWLGRIGARSDGGAFDVVCMQAAAYQRSREAREQDDRDMRAWCLGFLREIRPHA